MSTEDYERQVLQDVARQQQQRERYLADRELDQLLNATNARRRKRGLPERTREQAQEELDPRRPQPRPAEPPRES